MYARTLRDSVGETTTTFMKNSLGLCALSLLVACAGAHAAAIQVLPLSQNVNAGDPFIVTLQISGLGAGSAPSVGTFDIDLGFDSSLVSFVSTAYGTGLDIFGLGDLQFTTPGAGTVNLFELSLDGATDLNSLQPASFVLATLSFSALANGTSPFILSLNALGDADGNALPATLQNGSVIIGSSTPSIPEPATLLLLFGGLGAIGLFSDSWIKRS